MWLRAVGEMMIDDDRGGGFVFHECVAHYLLMMLEIFSWLMIGHQILRYMFVIFLPILFHFFNAVCVVFCIFSFQCGYCSFTLFVSPSSDPLGSSNITLPNFSSVCVCVCVDADITDGYRLMSWKEKRILTQQWISISEKLF